MSIIVAKKPVAHATQKGKDMSKEETKLTEHFTSILGERYGRLVVLSRVENDKFQKTRWLCKCDCGNECVVNRSHLTSGKIKSCGCIKKEMLSNRPNAHHLTGTKLYWVWAGIKSRCVNKNNKCYMRYGGRGITICDEWKKDFMAFYNWAISNGYKEGLTIERINNDGNYEPNNCRWATMLEQAQNRHEKTTDITRLSQNFTLEELCKTSHKEFQQKNLEYGKIIKTRLENTAGFLEEVREFLGCPLLITSGVRCPELNAAVGGAATSQHMSGEAADVIPQGKDTIEDCFCKIFKSHLIYDQMILEVSGGKVWLHLSYRGMRGRRQALTYNGKKYIEYKG